MLLDLDMPGQGKVPAIAQVTKQSFVYAFNRLTGEPLWPMIDRPVTQSLVPGEVLSATQPFPSKPAAFDVQGLAINDLVDWTPELRQQAITALADYQIGPLFLPPLHRDNDLGKRGMMLCPGGGGGANITAPPVADPVSGYLYVSSHTACSAVQLVPGEEADTQYAEPTGVTYSQYANGPGAGAPRHPAGIPLYKPPYSRITAIDMNTGEHAWMIPTGETPARVANNPALQGIDIGNTGTGNLVPMVVTKNMLVYSDTATDGTPMLYAINKASGNIEAEIEVPARSRYGMSSWVHEGRQFIMLQTGSSLTAMALPSDEEVGGRAH